MNVDIMQVSIMPIDNVWEADDLININLKKSFLLHMKNLFSEIIKNKDNWHPGSNNTVLYLVHLSIYPYIHGVPQGYVHPHWKNYF